MPGVGISVRINNNPGGGGVGKQGAAYLGIGNFTTIRATTRTVWGYPADGVIADGMSLLTIPTNITAFTGGRLLADNTWSDKDANGVQLYPAVSVADAGTNKVLCREANPVDLINVGVSGGGATPASLALVDYTVQLDAAGISGVASLGDVYEVDNSAGDTTAYFTVFGATGSTNEHTISCYCIADVEYTAGFGFSYGERSPETVTTEFTRISQTRTPGGMDRAIVLEIPAGRIAAYILPQLEDSPAVTPVMYNDLLATTTRAADQVSINTPSVLSAESGGIEFTGDLAPMQSFPHIISQYVDSDNNWAVFHDGVHWDLANSISGVSQTLAGNDYVYTPGTLQILQFYWSPVGFGLRAANASGGISTVPFEMMSDGRGVVVAPTIEIGNKNGADFCAGDYPVDSFKFYSSKGAAGW